MIEDIFEKGLEDESTIEGLLSNYKKYVNRISTLESAIANIERYSCLDGATSNYDPMPGKTGYKDCAMETYVCNNDEATREFKVLKDKYEKKVKSIDTLIDTLTDITDRIIIRANYFKGMKLQPIADETGFSLSKIAKSKADSLIKLQETHQQNQNIINSLQLH